MAAIIGPVSSACRQSITFPIILRRLTTKLSRGQRAKRVGRRMERLVRPCHSPVSADRISFARRLISLDVFADVEHILNLAGEFPLYSNNLLSYRFIGVTPLIIEPFDKFIAVVKPTECGLPQPTVRTRLPKPHYVLVGVGQIKSPLVKEG